jgi:hypothetical protein
MKNKRDESINLKEELSQLSANHQELLEKHFHLHKWLVENLISGDFCLYETNTGLALHNELCVLLNLTSKIIK